MPILIIYDKRRLTMRRNLEKDTVSVVVLLPTEVYEAYAETLNDRGLKRQKYSSDIFQRAVEQDMAEYKKSIKKKAV